MPTKSTSLTTQIHPKPKKIKSILVSQPKPERSPYFELEQKYNLHIDWRPLVTVEGVTEKEFRKNRIRPDEFTSIIFTTKNAIEHFFRLCEEMRIKMPQNTKYFCSTEAVANYLQKFILFRKRKVFAGDKALDDIAHYFTKHRENEKFLVPTSDTGTNVLTNFLTSVKVDFKEAVIYRTVSADLSDLKDIKYDVLVFFSVYDIKSVFDNFPDWEQGETRIATFGSSTSKAVNELNLRLDIQAPTPESPSMTMALENYLKVSNK